MRARERSCLCRARRCPVRGAAPFSSAHPVTPRRVRLVRRRVERVRRLRQLHVLRGRRRPARRGPLPRRQCVEAVQHLLREILAEALREAPRRAGGVEDPRRRHVPCGGEEREGEGGTRGVNERRERDSSGGAEYRRVVRGVSSLSHRTVGRPASTEDVRPLLDVRLVPLEQLCDVVR